MGRLETFGLSVIPPFYLQKGHVRFNPHGCHGYLSSKEAGSLNGCFSVLNLCAKVTTNQRRFIELRFHNGVCLANLGATKELLVGLFTKAKRG